MKKVFAIAIVLMFTGSVYGQSVSINKQVGIKDTVKIDEMLDKIDLKLKVAEKFKTSDASVSLRRIDQWFFLADNYIKDLEQSDMYNTYKQCIIYRRNRYNELWKSYTCRP